MTLCMTQTDRENPQFRCYNRSSSLKYGKTNSALGFSKYLCPSLNTQSCIKGAFGGKGFLLLGHLGSQASTEKKRFWIDYEQLLRAVFFSF